MRWLKIGGVIFGAMAVTALGIDAADTLSGSRSTLLGQLVATEVGNCPDGMIEVGAATSFTCVDMYEASAGEDCPVSDPSNQFDTNQNRDANECGSTSQTAAPPWRFIDRDTAQLMCVRSGKRLPTNEEWQLIAAGTPDTEDKCNISTRAVHQSGDNEQCVSAIGVFDAVGNIWEWTHDDVFDGVYNGRKLPEDGFVQQADRGGVATLTSSSSVDQFGSDYFWSKEIGAFAIMRGGFYGSKSDAGVYATHAATAPTMIGAAIGFRCVL